MSDMESIAFKKSFLYCLIASVVIAALVGISAILSGDFGWIQVRILLTTLTIAAASMCGLSCWIHRVTKKARVLPLSGLALALVGSVLIIVGLWGEIDSEAYWKTAASISVFAVACAHLSLLSLARLAQMFQWSLIVAHVVIFGVATLIVILILGEIEEEAMFRLLAVAAIIDAAFTVLIPIFHRLSRSQDIASADPAARNAAIEAEIARLTARIEELKKLRDETTRKPEPKR